METRTGMMPVCGALLLCILGILSIRAWQGADLANELRGLSANFSFQNFDTEMAQVRTEIRDNLGFESDSLDENSTSDNLATRQKMKSDVDWGQVPQAQFSLEKLAQSRHFMAASESHSEPIVADQFAEIDEWVPTEPPMEDWEVTITKDVDLDLSSVRFPQPNLQITAEPVFEDAVPLVLETAIETEKALAAEETPIEFATREVESARNEIQSVMEPVLPSRPAFELESVLDATPVSNIETVEEQKVNVSAIKTRKKKPVNKSAWAHPSGLVKEIEFLYDYPLTASWARSTVQVLNGLQSLNDLSDENINVVMEQLAGQIEQLDFLTIQSSIYPVESAASAQGEVATQLRQIRYSIEKRLQIWPLVHELSLRQTDRIGEIDSSQVGQFLLASTYRLNTEGIEKGWAEYLKLSDAAEVFNSLNANDFARKKAARAVLARLYSPSLNREQKQYLHSAIDKDTIGVLKACSTDAIDLKQLVKRIEKFEANENGATQFYLNDSYQSLLWSDDIRDQKLAHQLQCHYRNANFRVSVSEELLNRMVPQPPTMRQPYRDNILGAEVVGQNRISNQLQLSLIPDPEQISMKLETFGKVDSRTTASRSGIVVENQGTSRFRIIKRLALGQHGIFAYRPQTTSQVAQRVVGMRSNLDKIPPLGWVARRIASNKIAEQAPATKRYAQQQLEAQAENIFDQEVENMLNDLETSLTNNLLHPLIAMDLDPDPVEISTTKERINMRYRLAGRDQMSASTARPRGVASSLMSMQIHESAINNTLSRFDVAGKKFTTEELIDYLNQTFGEGFVQVDSSKQKPAKFEFAPFDPVRVQFEEQAISIVINLRSFQIGKGKRWKNLVIKSTYDPQVIGGFNIGMTQSKEGLRIKGKRLNVGDQLAIGVICEVMFPEQLQIAMMPGQLAQQLKVAQAETSQFVVSNGWLGISLDDPPMAYPQQNLGQATRSNGKPDSRPYKR